MSSNPRALMHFGRILSSWIVLAIAATGGAYFGSHLLADIDSFDAGRGDRFIYPHDHYLQLLVATGSGNLQRVAYSELGKIRSRHPRASLRIADSSLAVELNTPRPEAHLDYRVVSQDADALLIETRYSDSEFKITSRYRVDGERVTPLYCHVWNPWLIAQALLYMGLPLALAIWLLGRLLQKHEERVLLARGERPYMQHRYRLT
ncbi:MAG: hypothetical protein OET44_03760 [Gammaproteobacteria bacterium]|nr:hypothetical protein [Gammaproteobacteria bacterium]